MTPDTVSKWIKAFFESRWTGHLALGFLVAAAAWLVGSMDRLWAVPPDTILLGLVLGVSGLTYSCDHVLTRWLL